MTAVIKFSLGLFVLCHPYDSLLLFLCVDSHEGCHEGCKWFLTGYLREFFSLLIILKIILHNDYRELMRHTVGSRSQSFSSSHICMRQDESGHYDPLVVRKLESEIRRLIWIRFSCSLSFYFPTVRISVIHDEGDLWIKRGMTRASDLR